MAVPLDTNILVYLYDSRSPRKQQIARDLLRSAIESGQARVPHQAIIKFVAATTRGRTLAGTETVPLFFRLFALVFPARAAPSEEKRVFFPQVMSIPTLLGSDDRPVERNIGIAGRTTEESTLSGGQSRSGQSLRFSIVGLCPLDSPTAVRSGEVRAKGSASLLCERVLVTDHLVAQGRATSGPSTIIVSTSSRLDRPECSTYE